MIVHPQPLPPDLAYDAAKGRLRPLPYRASPNCDARPWIDALFMNRLPPDLHPYFAEVHQLRVSAHLLVDRAGRAVQYVPLDRRAWHAGASCFAGRERCNDFSIGIELEGLPGLPFTDAQYATLAALVEVLRDAFPGITAERVVGHSDIAPGRKEDPGPRFDWARLRRLAALV